MSKEFKLNPRYLYPNDSNTVYPDDTLFAALSPGVGKVHLVSTPSEPNPFYELAGESILNSSKEQNMNSNCYPITLDTNWSWDHPDLPKGEIWIHNRKFKIASADGNLLGMSVAPTSVNEITSRSVYPNLDGVRSLQVLINTSFGLRVNDGVEWEGVGVGAISILTKSGEHYTKGLELGYNIRDWCPGNSPWAVFKLRAEHTTPAWESDGNLFDLLELCFGDPIDIARISIQAQLDIPEASPAKLFQLKAKVKKGKKGKKVKAEIIRKLIAESFPSINILGMTAVK